MNDPRESRYTEEQSQQHEVRRHAARSLDGRLLDDVASAVALDTDHRRADRDWRRFWCGRNAAGHVWAGTVALDFYLLSTFHQIVCELNPIDRLHIATSTTNLARPRGLVKGH